ncbi:hypothetical protein HQ531_06685 [bacterium]|nr:hypothetical protein [bacterium]
MSRQSSVSGDGIFAGPELFSYRLSRSVRALRYDLDSIVIYNHLSTEALAQVVSVSGYFS